MARGQGGSCTGTKAQTRASESVTLPRFRVLYRHGGVTVPIVVEAPNAETAIMRAGMRRAELLYLNWVELSHRRLKWERLSVVEVGPDVPLSA
jgi:hypothetical protein